MAAQAGWTNVPLAPRGVSPRLVSLVALSLHHVTQSFRKRYERLPKFQTFSKIQLLILTVHPLFPPNPLFFPFFPTCTSAHRSRLRKPFHFYSYLSFIPAFRLLPFLISQKEPYFPSRPFALCSASDRRRLHHPRRTYKVTLSTTFSSVYLFGFLGCG